MEQDIVATLNIQLDKTSYNVGDTVVATLIIGGIAPETRTVTGTCTVDGVVLNAQVDFNLTHSVTARNVPGATQDATNPNVWRKAAA